MYNKYWKIMFIFVLILSLGGCMFIGKNDPDNIKNYKPIDEITPSLIFEQCSDDLKGFATNNWDLVKKTVNEYTVKYFNFSSEPTFIFDLGKAPEVIVKSLEHEKVYLRIHCSYNNEKNGFWLDENDNFIKGLQISFTEQIINNAFSEDLAELNRVANQFIKVNNLKTYNESTQQVFGVSNKFEFKNFYAKEPKGIEIHKELIEYCINNNSYDMEYIKQFVIENSKPISKTDLSGTGASINIFTDVDHIGKNFTLSFKEYIEKQNLKLPNFLYTIHNNGEMCMYATPLLLNETSRVVFANDFYLQDASDSVVIDDYRKKFRQVRRISW